MAKKSKKKQPDLLYTIAGYVKKYPVIPFLYWVLYFVVLLVMLDYFRMFEIQDHMIIFSKNYLHMISVFLMTALFFAVDSMVHQKMLHLSVKSSTKSESKQEQEEPVVIVSENAEENPGETSEPEAPVKVEQYFRLNGFEQPANGVQDFMNSCYHNTFRITLPETIQGYEIPNEFRFFYLHFEFENQKHDFLLDDVVQKLKFQVFNSEQSPDALIYRVKIFYMTQLDPKIKTSGDIADFTIEIKLALNHSKIQEFSMSIPEDSVSFWNVVKSRILNLFFPQQEKNCSSSSPKCRTDFQDTTRLEPMFLYDNSELVFYHRKETKKYSPRIFCYYNFSMITCPVCHNRIHDLGIPGIVLYRNLNQEILETSDEILDYLVKLEKNSDLTKKEKNMLAMVRFATFKNMKNNIILPESLADDLHFRLHAAREHVRIPLGKYYTTGIKAFTCREYAEEREFLQQFNTALHENLSSINTAPKGLYLLKAGKLTEDNFRQYYIHNSMIAQLCSQCWNPLPEKFYNYTAVITIYFFGNSNAGKTVLLCSGYNMIEDENLKSDPRNQKLNKFNVIYLNTTDSISSYVEKAKLLKEGVFPPGTGQRDAIPGKLSSLEISYNGRYHYMFNCCDMPGVKSVENWASYRNFSYVYTLLDDTLSLGKDSFYHTLSELVPVDFGGNVDARVYNMQLYLTKIDEYPLFLYQKILALNKAWKEWQSNYNGNDYLKNTLIYTLELLSILEQELKQDFRQRPAHEIIPERIQESIQEFSRETLDFSKPYFVLHGDIIRNFSTETSDGTIQELQDVKALTVLNYLHGLDVIRDNYKKFRDLILLTSQNMYRNAMNQRYSNYFFCVYAVSATGYSTIESQRMQPPVYQAEFVKESHDMLQHTTYEFEADHREMQKRMDIAPEQSSEISKCRRYLFSEFAIHDGEFCSENYQNLSETAPVWKRIRDLYQNSFSYSDLYADNYDTLIRKLKTSQQPDSIKTLYYWYAKRHYATHEGAVL